MPSTSPQPVAASLTRAAMFLVVTMNDGPEHEAIVRGLCGDLSGLLRSVGFRDLYSRLSCVMAFGSDAWDRLFGAPRPKVARGPILARTVDYVLKHSASRVLIAAGRRAA